MSDRYERESLAAYLAEKRTLAQVAAFQHVGLSQAREWLRNLKQHGYDVQSRRNLAGTMYVIPKKESEK